MSTNITVIYTNVFFPPWAVVVPILALGLVAGIIFGSTRWNQPGGKAITIVAGLLLLALLLFVAVVALLVWSADRGHPM